MTTLHAVATQSNHPEDRLLVEPTNRILADIAGALDAAYGGMSPADVSSETPQTVQNRFTLMWHSVLKGTPYEGIVEGLAERAVVLLEARAQVTRPVMQTIADVAVQDRTTQTLTSLLVELRESGEGWSHVMSTARQHNGGGEDTVAMGRAHPLISILGNSHLLSAVRAEAFAHLEMYVRSGHAARDLGSDPLDGMQEKEQRTIGRLRDITEQLSQGKHVSDASLISALEDRFEQVFIKTKLARRANGTNTLQAVGDRFSLRKLPGKGQISILIRNANDPSQILMACGTANRDTTLEGDQIPRFVAAVEHAIEARDYPFGAAPAEKAQKIRELAAREMRGLTQQEKHQVEGGGTLHGVWLFAPALFPERNSQRGIMRDDLRRLTTQVGGKWSQQLLDNVRSLQVWRILDSQISGSQGKADDWIRTNLGTFGGSSGWKPGERNIGQSTTQALYSEAAQQLCELAKLGGQIARTGMERGWQAHHAVAKHAEVLLTPLRQAMRGLWRHGQGITSVVEAFDGVREDIDAMARYMKSIQMIKEHEEWFVLDGAIRVAAQSAQRGQVVELATQPHPNSNITNTKQDPVAVLAGRDDKPKKHNSVVISTPQERGKKVPKVGSAEWRKLYRSPGNNEYQERHHLGQQWIAENEGAWKGSAHWNGIKKSVMDMEVACCTKAMRILLEKVDPRVFSTTLDKLWIDGTAFRGADPEIQVQWATSISESYPAWTPKPGRTTKVAIVKAPSTQKQAIATTTHAERAETASDGKTDKSNKDEALSAKQNNNSSTTAPGTYPSPKKIKRPKRPYGGRVAVSTYRLGQITDLSYVPTGKFKRVIQTVAQNVRENMEFATSQENSTPRTDHFTPDGVILPTQTGPRPPRR